MKFAIDPVYGCHRWLGAFDRDGYPVIWSGRRPRSATRDAYETEVGPIPADRYLDHLCRNRACVNVAHLEPVTQSENELRKSYRYRVKRVSCPRGHALSLYGIMTPDGGRVCRQCHRDQHGNI